MAGREEAAARVIREDFLEAVTRMQVAQGEPLRQRVCHCLASPPDASSRARCVPLVVCPCQPTASPLRRRPVHDDVDPQDLHGVEGVGQVAHGGQRDEAQGRDAPAGHTHGRSPAAPRPGH